MVVKETGKLAQQRAEAVIMYGERPPKEGLDVKLALSLYKRTDEYTAVESELRRQALVGYHAPLHAWGRAPWLSLKGGERVIEDAREERIRLYTWKRIPHRKIRRLRTTLQEPIEDMDERKPRAVDRRKAPLINPGHFVYGVELLLDLYPESSHWDYEDIQGAVASWWGITPSYIDEILEDDDYLERIVELNPRVATLLWDEAEVRRIGKEIQRRIAAEEKEYASKRADALSQAAKQAVERTVPTTFVQVTLAQVADAVHTMLQGNQSVWGERQEMSYQQRIVLVSDELGVQADDLAGVMSEPEMLQALGELDPVAADYIAYPVTDEIIASAKRLDATFVARALRAQQEGIAGYYRIAAAIGEGMHLHPGAYGSKFWRQHYESYIGSTIAHYIGKPPLPKVVTNGFAL